MEAPSITRITLWDSGINGTPDPVPQGELQAGVFCVYHPYTDGRGLWGAAIVTLFVGFAENAQPTGGGGNTCF
jgi:hypothetical protein